MKTIIVSQEEKNMKKKSLLSAISLALCLLMLFSLCACAKPVIPGDDQVVIDGLIDNEMHLDPDGDFDKDGLLNKEEDEYKTNPLAVDTDLDGVSDYDEVRKYNTNPLVRDTDEDTVYDGLEINLKLDPLNKKTDGKTADGKRKIEKEFAYNDSVKLTMSCTPTAADVSISELNAINFKNVPGVCSPLYELYNGKQDFESARLTIQYNDNSLPKTSDRNNLAVFQLLPNGSFQEVGGTVDTVNHTVTAELKHFSYYFVADKTVVQKKQETNVYLLIDNSGSMYPKEMCESSDENDVDFKRVDMAKTLISMTDDTIHYGVGKFTGDFTPLSGFTDDKSLLNAKLDSIKTESETFNGTYIATSLIESIAQFSKDTFNRKFIIMLTDGATTEGTGLFSFSWYDEDDAIKEANENNITIIAIGLGSGVNPDYLTKITSGTGGFYVFANDADALERVYATLMAALNYGFVDLDDDGECDHILLADSGFDASKNGWQFQNYYFIPDTSDEVTNGQCFGLAAVAQLYYCMGKLPMTGQEIERYLASGFARQQYLSSSGFDISDVSFFGEKHNLSDFKLFGDLDSLLRQKSKNLYVRDKDDSKHLMYNETVLNAVKEYPHLLTIRTSENKSERIWSGDSQPYTRVDVIVYTVNGVNYEELTDKEKDAYNVLKMIYWYFVIQNKGDEYFRTIKVGSTDLEKNIRQREFEYMISRIEAGVPLIATCTGHAVNATKVYKNIDNANEYVVAIYDNNYPSEERHITITKSKDTGLLDATAWYNDYEYTIIDTDGIFGDKGDDVTLVLDFVEAKRDSFDFGG